jgi:hypothetical protein
MSQKRKLSIEIEILIVRSLLFEHFNQINYY